MYRTNNFGWKLTHVLCTLSHLGLIVGGAIAYVYNLGKETQTRSLQLRNLVTSHMNSPCGVVLNDRLSYATASGASGPFAGFEFEFDVSTHALPISCMAIGVLGLVINIGLLATLLAVEKAEVTLTEGEQHWRRQIATFFSCVFNLLLAGAGVGLACGLGMKVAGSTSLIAPLVWASIQAPLCLTTALFDGVKNHRDGKDLLD
ncbi:hypothetical protein B0T17DRAFT_592774 [Bombardia bombarda]|uniref:Transmembrane protein n=1 Tax=Bombardia bombarda TaxID=252184 RepID=A0AA39WGF5_9PEZI|nr:hypothetical protein B0T17DRAFT_592774 [Bombardia bombarda]